MTQASELTLHIQGHGIPVAVAVGVVAGLSAAVLLPQHFALGLLFALTIGFAVVKPTWALAIVLLAIPFDHLTLQVGPVGLAPVQIAGLLLLALAAASAIASRGFVLPRTPLDAAILLWIGITFLGGIEALDSVAVLKHAGMATVFAGMFYVTAAIVKTPRQVVLVFWAAVIGLSALGTYAIWMYVNYLVGGGEASAALILWSEGLRVPRAAGTVGDPNLLGSLMMMGIPLSLALAVLSESSRAKLLAVATTGVLLTALALTYGRGAWLATLAALLVLATDRRFRMVLLIIAVAVAAMMPTVALERAATAVRFQRSEIASRFNYWSAALEMIPQRPLFGLGFDNYEANYRRLPLPETASRVPNHPHNTFLTVLAETGIAGVLTYYLLIGAALAVAWRGRRRDGTTVTSVARLAIAAVIVGQLVGGLTNNLLLSPSLNSVLWILMALAAVLADLDARTGNQTHGAVSSAAA